MATHTSTNILVSIRRKIINWYIENGRNYPWRSSVDPYEILIAEILLRRTTATAVMRVYEGFLKQFNSIKKLAEAKESEIAKIITSLGLQRIRAASLKSLATSIVQDCQGIIRNDMDTLETLPGVGRYIAAATSNFAFGMNEPLVDGNILHLLSRLFDLHYSGPTDENAWTFMIRFGGSEQKNEFYWGIIDLVASVCIRRVPRCTKCPLPAWCHYYQTNK